MNSVTQLVGGIWTHAAWPADLEHDKFYEELPAAMRADVAAEITQEIFDKSCFLSVLVRLSPPVVCSLLGFRQLACKAICLDKAKEKLLSVCMLLSMGCAVLEPCTSLLSIYAAVTMLHITPTACLGSAHTVCTRPSCITDSLQKLVSPLETVGAC